MTVRAGCERILVGASNVTDSSGTGYVFENVGGVWSEVAVADAARSGSHRVVKIGGELQVADFDPELNYYWLHYAEEPGAAAARNEAYEVRIDSEGELLRAAISRVSFFDQPALSACSEPRDAGAFASVTVDHEVLLSLFPPMNGPNLVRSDPLPDTTIDLATSSYRRSSQFFVRSSRPSASPNTTNATVGVYTLSPTLIRFRNIPPFSGISRTRDLEGPEILLPPPGLTDAAFGAKLAAYDFFANQYVAVGAPEAASGAGTVVLYKNTFEGWTQVAEIAGPPGTIGFGHELAFDTMAAPPVLYIGTRSADAARQSVYAVVASDYFLDTDSNGRSDTEDVIFGVVPDCDGNGIPDATDIARDPSLDADASGTLDACEIDLVVTRGIMADVVYGNLLAVSGFDDAVRVGSEIASGVPNGNGPSSGGNGQVQTLLGPGPRETVFPRPGSNPEIAPVVALSSRGPRVFAAVDDRASNNASLNVNFEGYAERAPVAPPGAGTWTPIRTGLGLSSPESVGFRDDLVGVGANQTKRTPWGALLEPDATPHFMIISSAPEADRKLGTFQLSDGYQYLIMHERRIESTTGRIGSWLRVSRRPVPSDTWATVGGNFQAHGVLGPHELNDALFGYDFSDLLGPPEIQDNAYNVHQESTIAVGKGTAVFVSYATALLALDGTFDSSPFSVVISPDDISVVSSSASVTSFGDMSIAFHPNAGFLWVARGPSSTLDRAELWRSQDGLDWSLSQVITVDDVPDAQFLLNPSLVGDAANAAIVFTVPSASTTSKRLVVYGIPFRDCNGNLINDIDEIAAGTATDCNANQIPDSCELADGLVEDCNENGVPDLCDVQAGARAEIVVVFDTSSSMDDEAATICAAVDELQSDLIGMGLDAEVELLGVNEVPGRIGYQCLTGSVADQFGSELPGIDIETNEDWGPAVTQVALSRTWSSTYRIVIPVSDEGPAGGDACSDPGNDRDAIDEAIAACTAAGVAVLPVVGAEADSCVRSLMTELAEATRGRLVESDPIQALLTDRLVAAVRAQAVSLDTNGNGVPDECEIASGDLLDCNLNGIADDFEIATMGGDCDDNGIPDGCQTQLVTISSGVLPPPDASMPVEFPLVGVPEAGSDVLIDMRIRGDFGSLVEEATLFADGLELATIYAGNNVEWECAPGVDRPLAPGLTIDAKTFNSLASDGQIVLSLESSFGVNGGPGGDCPNAFVEFALSYYTPSIDDCNGNGRPDICDVFDGTLPSLPDCSGPPCTADVAEPFGDLDIDDVLTFLSAFAAGSSLADVAPPSGTLDVDDILTFLASFSAGCQ
ncbi:MAG: GC-type dockerin domain-anchored protein [Phycisphaerales bacterium]